MIKFINPCLGLVQFQVKAASLFSRLTVQNGAKFGYKIIIILPDNFIYDSFDSL